MLFIIGVRDKEEMKGTEVFVSPQVKGIVKFVLIWTSSSWDYIKSRFSWANNFLRWLVKGNLFNNERCQIFNAYFDMEVYTIILVSIAHTCETKAYICRPTTLIVILTSKPP